MWKNIDLLEDLVPVRVHRAGRCAILISACRLNLLFMISMPALKSHMHPSLLLASRQMLVFIDRRMAPPSPLPSHPHPTVAHQPWNAIQTPPSISSPAAVVLDWRNTEGGCGGEIDSAGDGAGGAQRFDGRLQRRHVEPSQTASGPGWRPTPATEPRQHAWPAAHGNRPAAAQDAIDTEAPEPAPWPAAKRRCEDEPAQGLSPVQAWPWDGRLQRHRIEPSDACGPEWRRRQSSGSLSMATEQRQAWPPAHGAAHPAAAQHAVAAEAPAPAPRDGGGRAPTDSAICGGGRGGGDSSRPPSATAPGRFQDTQPGGGPSPSDATRNCPDPFHGDWPHW